MLSSVRGIQLHLSVSGINVNGSHIARPHTQQSRFTPNFLPTAQILLLAWRIQFDVDNYFTPNNFFAGPLQKCSAWCPGRSLPQPLDVPDGKP